MVAEYIGRTAKDVDEYFLYKFDKRESGDALEVLAFWELVDECKRYAFLYYDLEI